MKIGLARDHRLMKIRRLEIQGFKSFADRTVLRFGDGITGVVGPNGCGKSNIVDAIRWVMGEQSAKQLRGAGMQDVIFQGCEARGPMSLCEVTLGFENTGGLVPPEYGNLDEIAVTRRLYRDGNSRYAINGVNCRLRDILDLFMGTGVGKNAYSIIEQGRIGMIVTAKAEDRRAIIEDAAGVSRYKARRKQAERRIEATEQNLLRVTDMTDELAKQQTKLERQAKKAERYKTLRAEQRELELHAASHRYLELWSKERFEAKCAREIEAVIAAQTTQIADFDAELQADQEALEAGHEALLQQEGALGESRQAQALAEKQRHHLESERTKLTRDKAQATDEEAKLAEEGIGLKARRSEAEAQHTGLEDESARKAELTALEAELQRQKAQLLTEEQAKEAARRQLETTRQTVGAKSVKLTALKNRQADLQEQRAELDPQKAEAEAGLRTHEQAAVTAKATLETQRQTKRQLDTEEETHKEALVRLTADLKRVGAQLAEDRERWLSAKSRHASLSKIQENYEGCSEAVRKLLATRESDASEDLNLHGLVADIIRTEPRYEAAVEAVLGERLQSVIVSELDDSLRSVDFLKQKQAGRSSFVPLSLRPQSPMLAPSSRPPITQGEDASSTWPSPQAGECVSELPDLEAARLAAPEGDLPIPEALGSMLSWQEDRASLLDDPDVIGRMQELIVAEPGYDELARGLIGETWVVTDAEALARIWRSEPGIHLVSLSGEVIDPVGVLTGGSSAAATSGLLARKREIHELSELILRLSTKVTLGEEARERCKTERKAAEDALSRLKEARHREELAILNLERDLKRHQEAITQQTRRLSEHEAKASRIAAKEAELADELTETQGQLFEAESQIDGLKADFDRRTEALKTETAALASLAERVTKLRIQLAAERERREHLQSTLAHIDERLQAITKRSHWLAELKDGFEDKRRELDSGKAEAEADIAKAESEIQRLTETVKAQKARLADLKEAHKAKEAEHKRLRQALEAEKEKRQSTLIRVRESQIARQNLEASVEERYQACLADLVSSYHLLDPQTPRDLERLNRVKKQLSNIGAINLTAIEEFKEVSERYRFLMAQKADLDSALASLRSAIRRINATSKARYLEAFRRVDEKFQQVFPKLFKGGRAALKMLDPSDPLESGIDMLAEPPGKKLQSVNLLSGGEKALTAVALIFAIFLIKPTPFCLLDEVDAPLDEANVGRYNEILREMSTISQFILITHNKRTMELPDRLYGVTMETPGISKLMPVDVIGEAEAA